MTTATTTNANTTAATEQPTIAAAKAIKRARSSSAAKPKLNKLDAAMAKYQEAAQEVAEAADVPNWKRVVVGQLSGLFTGGTVYYIGVTFTDVAIVSAMSMGAGAFITFMIAFIGVCVSIAAMIAAYATTVSVVERFDLTKFKAGAKQLGERAKQVIARDNNVPSHA